MKKFFVTLTIVIAFCINGFAQKKVAADPCLSKDPKVRATSKKPCPSAPVRKTKPENSDDDDTTDGKTSKNDADNGGIFFIMIEHNGAKTELAYSQFENHSGLAMLENEKSRRLTFSYGAGNDRANNDFFDFHGMIPVAAKGTYAFGTNGVNFLFKTSKFPNVPVFLCESGNYEIGAVSLAGGFVEGSFSAQCISEVRDDGSPEKYSLSGRFKVMRMM